MTRRLRCGISLQIGGAVMTIIAAAAYWLLMLEAWNPLKAKSDELVVNASAQQATDWIGLGMDNYLLIVLGVTVIGMISISVYLRQGGI